MIKINDKEVYSVLSAEKEIDKIMKGTLKVYEGWKTLIASGVPPLTLNKCKGVNLIDYKLYGNSVQDGTPAPEAPIEIESVGEYDATTGKYKIPIIARGKNLLDLRSIYGKTVSVNGGTLFCGADGGITGSGVATGYVGFDTFRIYLPKGKYILSASGEFKNIGCFLVLRDKNNVTLKEGGVVLPNGGFSFDVSDYPTFSYLAVTIKRNNNVEMSGTAYFQLEKGNGTKDYEPYKGEKATNIYLNEPLRKIDTYADYIDFTKQKVFRNVEKLILKGSELWYSSLENGKRRVFLNGRSSVKQNIVLSDKYVKDTVNYAYPDINKIMVNSAGSVIIGIDNTVFPDVETYKTWLKTNNVDVYLPLATPTEETIELPNIPTFKGTTILEVDTTQPSYMEVVYKGKGKLEKLNETDNIVLNSILASDTETQLNITNTEINEILDEIIGG